MFVDEHEEAIESEETDDTTWFISNTDKIHTVWYHAVGLATEVIWVCHEVDEFLGIQHVRDDGIMYWRQHLFVDAATQLKNKASIMRDNGKQKKVRISQEVLEMTATAHWNIDDETETQRYSCIYQVQQSSALFYIIIWLSFKQCLSTYNTFLCLSIRLSYVCSASHPSIYPSIHQSTHPSSHWVAVSRHTTS